MSGSPTLGQLGMYALAIGTGLVLTALALLATWWGWWGWWPSVGGFLTDQSGPALLAGYPLPAALPAGVGYLAIRRATP